MRTFNRLIGFIGGSVRRLAILVAVLGFFGGQLLGLWDSPSLVNVNVAPPDVTKVVLSSAMSSGDIWSGGARSAENARNHFEKHGAEFPFETEADYVQAAQAFVNNPPAGTMIVVQDDGDRVSYNPSQNYFAVSSPEGRIRTFFRPDPKIHGYKTNLDYFHAQERK